MVTFSPVPRKVGVSYTKGCLTICLTLIESGIFLLTKGGKVWVFQRTPEGKSEGWNGMPKACSRGEGQAFGLPFHPDNFPEGNPKENQYLPDIG